ncbi:MAG TPA: hypothetical protein VKY92_27280 [Verrucomicrobiae bacterium]|nr:hypothetical protein [Verrucomicrobiae bacterium]
MPNRDGVNPLASLDKLITGLPTAEYVMNMTVLYDDASSRGAATAIYSKVQSVVGFSALKGTWWKLGDLRHAGVLAGAVSKAIRSDMIVICVRQSEAVPLPFYFWVNAWLPHRLPGVGALVAMLESPDPANSEAGRLRKYLRVVARRARMDLLIAERARDRISFGV